MQPFKRVHSAWTARISAATTFRHLDPHSDRAGIRIDRVHQALARRLTCWPPMKARPSMVRHLHRGPELATGTKALIGTSAVALTPSTSNHTTRASRG